MPYEIGTKFQAKYVNTYIIQIVGIAAFGVYRVRDLKHNIEHNIDNDTLKFKFQLYIPKHHRIWYEVNGYDNPHK